MPLVRIQSDPRARLKPCLRCGYSLRHVPDARVCPECGLPVWLTLGGNDTLEMSNPQWLGRLALASLVLAAAHALLFVAVAALDAWLQLVVDEDVVVFLDWMKYLPFIGGAYFLACGGALILLGGAEGRIPDRARSLRRTVIVVGAVALVAGAWFIAPSYAFETPPFLILLLAHAQAIAGWLYLAHLARRIPSRRNETFARYFAIALTICFASIVLRGTGWIVFILVLPWSRNTIGWTLFLLAYLPLAAALFTYFARTFQKASKAARKNWEPEETATPSP